jgi:cyanosortase A-associated protein
MRSYFAPRVLAILLAVLATVVALVRTLLASEPIERPLDPVALPSESPLPGWRAEPGETDDPTKPNTNLFRQTQGDPAIELELQFIPNLPEHYVRNPRIVLRFLPHGHLPLEASLRHYVNSRTMVIVNLDTDLPIRENVAPRETGPRSAHGLWSAGQRRHLSTIITADGDAAMATRRVARNMYLDHLSVARIGDWLLGRTALPDRRCVLVHFSIPAAAENADERLEAAWAEWQRAFQPAFPD